MSHEEYDRRMTDLIDQYGWAIQGVEPGPGPGWAYTIGLIEHHDHPELVVVNAEFPTAQLVLNAFGELVADGERIEAETKVEIDGLAFPISAVHPAHLEGETFNQWHEVYRWLPEPPPLHVLEVQMPDELFCSHHRGNGPFLAGPHEPHERHGNRAARRAHQRQRRRRR